MSERRRTDSKQLIRQWAILRLLAGAARGYSVKELADQLGASKSTIQRDLATLEHEFALIVEHAGEQKRTYRLTGSLRQLERIRFGITELLALHAAGAALESLRGTPVHDDLDAVTRKIRGYLSEHHNGGLDALARVFLAQPRGYVDYREHDEIIDDLTDAAARRRRCRIDYHAAWKGTRREHLIKPLGLVWHRSALYLFAHVDDRTEITTFAVHRIEACDVIDEVFARTGADVAEHARRAFGIYVAAQEEDVEIVFDEEIAWFIEERVYHPDEQTERLPDGRLRYRIRSSARWEIIPWVQSFGPRATLVKPASWRVELCDNARAIVASHEE